MTSRVQTYVRLAGLLLLVSMFAGAFGEMYVPTKIIAAGDAAATARNLRESELLFRFGFAAYLVEATCDITLSLIFYVLLRPVSRGVSLLAAFFGLVSTATFAGAELIYFSSSLVLGDAAYLNAFSPDQRNVLAVLAIRTYGLGAGVFMVFYGTAMLIRGALMLRALFLPKFLGVLLAAAGVGFITRALLLVVAPKLASPLLLTPMFFAALSLAVWFLTKGVDVAKWEEAVNASTLRYGGQ
jgi:hypothetical protein